MRRWLQRFLRCSLPNPPLLLLACCMYIHRHTPLINKKTHCERMNHEENKPFSDLEKTEKEEQKKPVEQSNDDNIGAGKDPLLKPGDNVDLGFMNTVDEVFGERVENSVELGFTNTIYEENLVKPSLSTYSSPSQVECTKLPVYTVG
ncbi:hypothetical protein PIB30_103338 [Stylosanthes scabra]|uniref:Uncharacterized protein n=1 Tax=Stylosanthes scabra TaxID=79078 RepID=A0ABU6TXF6_9FABA|nr:hypothetical protein [Stylosanthes scabra]